MDARDTGFSRQIAEQAAEWFVDFSVGDVEPEQLARFNLWLRTSPLHVRAYLQLSAFWEEAELLKLDSEAMEALARRVASAAMWFHFKRWRATLRLIVALESAVSICRT